MTHGFIRLNLTDDEVKRVQTAAGQANQTTQQYIRAQLGFDPGPTGLEEPEPEPIKPARTKATRKAADATELAGAESPGTTN